MNAFDAAEKNGKAGYLQKELEVRFSSQNKARALARPPSPRPSCVPLFRFHNRKSLRQISCRKPAK
jgi:hypothetical protein